jgi:putative transposase
MARPLRPNIPGAVYHTMARGNERKPIYLSDRDRQRFLDLVRKTASRLGWRCLAYCLMENHYHLVVRTPKPNLSRGMRLLNGGYASYFNTRQERVGHLFQGRYRSVLIKSAEHLLSVLRYVITNPVAAGLVQRPQDWPWSSYGETIDGRNARGIVAPAETLAWFGPDPNARVSNFTSFMTDEGAITFLERDAGFPIEPSDPMQDRPAVEAILAARPGSVGIADAYHEHGYSLREIAAALGQSRTAVGRRLVAYESAQMLESGT